MLRSAAAYWLCSAAWLSPDASEAACTDAVTVSALPVSGVLTTGRSRRGAGDVGVVALADRVRQAVEPLDVVTHGVADEPAGRVGEREALGAGLRDVLLLSRSAVWLSRVSSAGENQVKALQSSPWKIRG